MEGGKVIKIEYKEFKEKQVEVSVMVTSVRKAQEKQ